MATTTYVKPDSVLARTAREVVQAHAGGSGPRDGMVTCPVCGEPLPCPTGRAAAEVLFAAGLAESSGLIEASRQGLGPSPFGVVTPAPVPGPAAAVFTPPFTAPPVAPVAAAPVAAAPVAAAPVVAPAVASAVASPVASVAWVGFAEPAATDGPGGRPEEEYGLSGDATPPPMVVPLKDEPAGLSPAWPAPDPAAPPTGIQAPSGLSFSASQPEAALEPDPRPRRSGLPPDLPSDLRPDLLSDVPPDLLSDIPPTAQAPAEPPAAEPFQAWSPTVPPSPAGSEAVGPASVDESVSGRQAFAVPDAEVTAVAAPRPAPPAVEEIDPLLLGPPLFTQQNRPLDAPQFARSTGPAEPTTYASASAYPSAGPVPQPPADPVPPQPGAVTAPQPGAVTAPQPGAVTPPQPGAVTAPQPGALGAPHPGGLNVPPAGGFDARDASAAHQAPEPGWLGAPEPGPLGVPELSGLQPPADRGYAGLTSPQPIGPGAGMPVVPAGPPQPIGFPVEHPAGTPPQAPPPSHFTASPAIANRPPLESPQMGQVNPQAEPATGAGTRPPLESPQMGQLNRPLGGAAEPSGLSGAPTPSQAFTRQVTHQPGGSFTQAAPPVPGTSGLPGAGSTGARPTGAGPTGAGPTGAGPTGAGPTGVGPTGAGPTGAGPTGAGPTGAGTTGAEPAGPATPPPSAGKPTGLHGMAGGTVTMPSGLGGAPAAAPKAPAEDPEDPQTPSGLPGR